LAGLATGLAGYGPKGWLTGLFIYGCTQFPGGVMRPTPAPGMGYEHRTHAKVADVFDVPTWDIGWLHCDSDLLAHLVPSLT
jgi:hypothetical protein